MKTNSLGTLEILHSLGTLVSPQDVGGTGMRAEIVIVTPLLAATWLSQNSKSQRTISAPTVEKYAADMRSGNWALTHQGICFNVQGVLVDGQHRLQAVIQAQTSVQMLVVRGLPLEYESQIDQGYGRTLAQVVKKRTRVIAAVHMLLRAERGVNLSHIKMSVAIFEETYAHHAVAIEALLSHVGGEKIPGGAFAALAWAYPLSPEEILSFAAQIKTGELLERKDPAYAIRGWFERNRRHAPHEAFFATCNAIRHVLDRSSLVNTYVGSTGYEALTGKRRARKIPYTPSTTIVPSR